MDFDAAIRLIAALACPIAMIWMMNKNMGGQPADSAHREPAAPDDLAARLAALRARQQALGTEIAEAARHTPVEPASSALGEVTGSATEGVTN